MQSPIADPQCYRTTTRGVVVPSPSNLCSNDEVTRCCDEQFITPPESIMPRRGGPTSRLSAPFVDAPVKMGRPRGDGPLGGERGTSLMTRFVPETPSEHVFYSWIVDNPYANIHEQLFSYNGWAATREDMLSLGIGSPVRVAVIDVSACILNVRELSRGEGAPRRQFTGIHTTLNTVVSRTQSRACRLAWFSESLECGLKLSPHPSWKSIDMKDLLSVFLDDEVDFIYRATVRRFVPTRMQMQWRDARNKVDCGVFAMRHMESFLGQSVNAWECGLQTGDTRYLDFLRMTYMREILSIEFNVYYYKNIRRAVAFQHTIGQN
nr:uncharacterized protein LOC109173369 [Ipomoea batatas]GMD80141.1 uncharacterized protein LOC109173369 [Ipomoea batatas]